MKVINFEKKKMILLTNKEYKSYLNWIKCQICKNKFDYKDTNWKNIVELKAIELMDKEMLCIAYVMEKRVYLKKRLEFITIDQTMISIFYKAKVGGES